MRKAILFLALGSFLAANVAAYACDGDKAGCDTKGKKSCPVPYRHYRR